LSEKDPPSITLTRTIYDPATKDFITSTPDAKALPHIKKWINQHNPVIYWYILRIDNPSDASIDQWAVELYAHQALSLTEVYVDGIDRRFEVRKRERDPWSEKYVLSIPRQVGIPIIGKGTRRIFFKVDIDCKEGLMHEYGISGAFMAQGMESLEIKEKMFQYSCKVGEFKQIFDKDPHEASHYAEKRLICKYSSNSVQVFTNSFRMIHELYGYCHSGSPNRDDLLQKLHLLHTSFEGVPEIAGERITPLIHDGIRELDVIVDRDKFAPRFMKLCDALVELLHIEVMGAEIKNEGAYTPPFKPETSKVSVTNNESHTGPGMKECPTCGNVIDSSNKSLICKECGTRFCTTCEEWFRGERKRGQKPLCEDCFTAEQKRIIEEERQKEKEEQERKAREETERKKREEESRQKEKEKQARKIREEAARKKREEERLQKEKEEQERKAQEVEERLQKEKEEQERQAREEDERKRREEAERLQKEKEGQERRAREEAEQKQREEKERKRREVEERLQKEREEQKRQAREEAERKRRVREEAWRKKREAEEQEKQAREEAEKKKLEEEAIRCKKEEERLEKEKKKTWDDYCELQERLRIKKETEEMNKEVQESQEQKYFNERNQEKKRQERIQRERKRKFLMVIFLIIVTLAFGYWRLFIFL